MYKYVAYYGTCTDCWQQSLVYIISKNDFIGSIDVKCIPPTTAGHLQRWTLLLMGYSFDIQSKSTKVFGNTNGLSCLPVGPDQCFGRQSRGKVNAGRWPNLFIHMY